MRQSALGARIAGVDEAGRGPLAGPVYAAAVILDESVIPVGLADSKLLKADRRQALAADIEVRAEAFAIASASCDEVDRLNILNATLLAMQRAVSRLPTSPTLVLVDGTHCPDFPGAMARAIVKGDRSVPAISAASILAKVARDREMLRLDALHPGYGFAQHKGYGTKAHLEAIRRLGPCAVHRATFAPVRAALALERV